MKDVKISVTFFERLRNLIETDPDVECLCITQNPPTWWKGETCRLLVPSGKWFKEYFAVRNGSTYYNPSVRKRTDEFFRSEYRKNVLQKTTPERIVKYLKRKFPGCKHFAFIDNERPGRESPRSFFMDWFNESEFSKKSGVKAIEHEKTVKTWKS